MKLFIPVSISAIETFTVFFFSFLNDRFFLISAGGQNEHYCTKENDMK
jgi:hypothetical protein